MSKNANHAIVFGAAGLLGWSVLNQLTSNYPESGTFSRVTAVVNRPISEPDLNLSSKGTQDSAKPKLQIVSGIDLRDGTGEALAHQLQTNVADAETITHVFYFGTLSPWLSDAVEECKINCDMMRRVVAAVNIISPALKAFIYPGGTRRLKGYGIYIPGGTFQAPLDEAMADQLPDDYAKTVAYPWFRKILTEASNGRGWSWTEVCPDAVIGFSPNGSGWSLALHWAQYLSLYSHNKGAGVATEGSKTPVPFPGCEEALDSKFTPVSSKILGRIAIFAALNPDVCGGKVINMADGAHPTTFRQLWPMIAAWFGLAGVGPSAETDAPKPGEYVKKHETIFSEKNRAKALSGGVGAGSKQLDSVGFCLTFDRQLSLERLRACGFHERRDPIEGWIEAFEQFREAGLIL
ncbi:unnamed protein product [Clonostachys solani]|uniref:PRISE-like Rossmann-fold domain-containing protein n=1 Tax=Clonostachys solani TaxID=160281 RepID=A0A9P0EG23_9HYPO|nr:unnamed protein product [Clonostachys solani]